MRAPLAFPDVDSADVHEFLERILGQPEFKASPRLSAFLRFVVEETLAGRASRLKAFTIATSVLGRDESFDPQTNPIVRVEALRLRRMLDQYYAGSGFSDRVEIRMRRGSYAPEFVHRMLPLPELAPGAVPIPLLPESGIEVVSAPALVRPTWWRDRRPAIAAAALLLCTGLILIASRSAGPPARHPDDILGYWPATVRVGPFETIGEDPVLGLFAGAMADRVEDSLSRFDNPVVLHDPAGDMKVDYQIRATVSLQPARSVKADFRMIRNIGGEIVWARSVDGLKLDRAPDNAVVDAVARTIGQTYGIVFSDMRKRLPSSVVALGGYGCVNYAYGVLGDPTTYDLQNAVDCLNRTLVSTPDFAPAYASRAALDIFAYLDGLGAGQASSLLEHAGADASRAVTLAPAKGHMHAALFLSRFYDGRFQDAFDSAETAIDLNPYAAETLGRIGAAYIARGEFEKGRALIQRGFQASPVQSGWLEFYRVLDAWNSGNLERAHRHAARHSAGRFPLGIIAKAMMAGEDGDRQAGSKWAERLAASYPNVAADIPAFLDRYRITPALRDRILAVLDHAGVPRVRAPSN